jgi:hypothetical protein
MRERMGRITRARADVWLVAVLLAVVALVLLPRVLHGRGVGNDASLPANLLTYVLPFWWSLGVVLVVKLVAAGLGTFLVARGLGLSRVPAAVAGVSRRGRGAATGSP